MSVISTVFELSAKAGQGPRLLRTYETLFGESPFNGSVEVDETIRNYELAEDETKGYVLFPLIPAYGSLCRRFCVLAHVFRTKGYKPLILRDNNELHIPPENTVDSENSSSRKARHTHRARKYPELFAIETKSIREVLDDTYEIPPIDTDKPGELRSFTYKDINLSDCAAASTRKYLKQYSLDLTDPTVKEVFQKFLSSGILLADATKKIVENYPVEITVVNEADYIQGKIPLQVCENKGVSVYTQGKGYHQESIVIGKTTNRYYKQQFASEELTTKAVSTELSTEERNRVQSIFEDRKAGNITPVQYTTNNDSSVTSDEDYLVGVFSHLLWDGALEPDQALYDDIYDWLDDTLQVAIEKDNTHFVVKSHPAEEIMGTNESIGEWIREQYAPLPENITFLPPDTDVNTYALIESLDAGIVYASTVGLEMALEGIPVISGGFPPYHGLGISYDPSKKSEYLEFLRNIEQVDYDSEREARAYRFAYFLFVCKHFDFPYLSNPGDTIRFDHEVIAEENGPYNKIVQQMVNNEDVIQPSCMDLK